MHAPLANPRFRQATPSKRTLDRGGKDIEYQQASPPPPSLSRSFLHLAFLLYSWAKPSTCIGLTFPNIYLGG